jgi:cytochrome b561
MSQKSLHYGAGSMLLHWIIATLVFTIGMTSPFLDHRTFPALSTYHNLGGCVVIALAVAWLVWQTSHPAPAQLSVIRPPERQIMGLAVSALNVLLLLAPISGIVYLFALGGSLEIGSIKVAVALSLPTARVDQLGILHHVLGALLVVTAGAHSLHAVWHHVKLRDGLLARMLPWH